jgi:hypothetical protein
MRCTGACERQISWGQISSPRSISWSSALSLSIGMIASSYLGSIGVMTPTLSSIAAAASRQRSSR